MAFLEVKHISVRFGGLHALWDVSFDLKKEEIIGLIGPNGAGKSTLFNVISGIQKPSTGEMLLRGDNIIGLRPDHICHRGVGRTFQTVQLFPEMTVYENVYVAGLFGNKRLLSQNAEEQTLWALKLCGILEGREAKVETTSLFDQRRLELARALATDPKILLLDEIVAGLNINETNIILDIISRVNQKGILVFIIEHDMRAIMTISQRIIVLVSGGKIADGTPEEVTNNPEVINSYLGEGYA